MLSILRQAAETPESTPFNFTISAWWVVVILSVIIPIVVGLLTKAGASSWVKALVNLVLTAVATLISANVNDTGQAVISQETFIMWAIATVISVATYLGVWQNLPTPGNKPNGINQLMAPNFGLGKAA